jgi:tetratricopeptide (TPR) repeat protein
MMPRSLPAWLLAVLSSIVIFPNPACAQATRPTATAGGWVGRRVIVPYGTTLHDGSQPVEDPHAKELALAGHGRQEFRVYTVERVEADRLWVTSSTGSARGWITSVEAIPLERAVDHYTARINSSPTDANNYANRAVIWTELGDLDRALVDDTEAIRLDPQNAMAYHNRGYTWAKKKDLDRAIADFTRAIAIDPKYARAYNKRGFAWLEKKMYARAVSDFSQAIKIDPKFARAYHNRGNTMLRQKDYDRAIADYTSALRYDPADVLALVDRASVYHAEGDDAHALADLAEAIRRKPDCTEALVDRAWLLATSPEAKVRDGKQAVLDATRACELTRGKEAYPLGALAAALAERGDFDRAVKSQERAQPLYKTRDDVARGRARLDLYKAKTPYREPAAASSLARPEGKAASPPAMGHLPAKPDGPTPGGRGM